jgi:hypothetical protein
MPINDSMAQAKRAKWVRYIKRIEPQVFRMMEFRSWNRIYEEIVNANPRLRPGIPVLDYFRHVYADYAALAVRRQSKQHADAISLLDLVEDISRFPEVLTLAWTINLYSQPTPTGHVYEPEIARDLAELTFKDYADASGLVFDGAIAGADAERLRTTTRKIVAIVDSTIAHDDKQLPTELSSFNELDDAITLIADLTRKYTLLLTGAAFGSMTPIDQTNAIGVFSFPWIDPKHPPKLKGSAL